MSSARGWTKSVRCTRSRWRCRRLGRRTPTAIGSRTRAAFCRRSTCVPCRARTDGGRVEQIPNSQRVAALDSRALKAQLWRCLMRRLRAAVSPLRPNSKGGAVELAETTPAADSERYRLFVACCRMPSGSSPPSVTALGRSSTGTASTVSASPSRTRSPLRDPEPSQNRAALSAALTP